MKDLLSGLSKTYWSLLFLYLAINILFIVKYFPEFGINPSMFSGMYVTGIIVLIIITNHYYKLFTEKIFKVLFIILLAGMCVGIFYLLLKIDRFSVNVDRWSAVTFFIDSFQKGEYPYAAHTHVSETNFPSPFPFWYVVNFPFYLLGDVGYGLIFFLIIAALVVYLYSRSYRKSFIFILLFCLSPAYWWEVSVRSDSLSNAFLVFIFIIWYENSSKTLSKNLFLSIISCGLLASTRMTALIPLAIYFFRPFTKICFWKKTVFIIGIGFIVFLFFSPFVFWNTETWIFFRRNPFLTQSSIGNKYVLLGMVLLGVFIALRWKTFQNFLSTTTIFFFIFILASQISLIIVYGINGNPFTDSRYDISYFNLILPYCIGYLSQLGNQYWAKTDEKIINLLDV